MGLHTTYAPLFLPLYWCSHDQSKNVALDANVPKNEIRDVNAVVVPTHGMVEDLSEGRGSGGL